jgi:hypothetical protein
MEFVRRQLTVSMVILLLSVLLNTGFAAGQLPPHYISIHIPDGVGSENVFIRYILAGEDIGGWVQPRADVSSYVIGTTHEGQTAARIKAVLYAPGCAIQTIDFPLSNSTNPQYSFLCQPLSSIWITGKLTQTERLSGREVKLQARYIARWAQDFQGLSAAIPLTIPVGDAADLSADNSFQLSVPDLSKDPLAGTSDHPGELQIWAKDKSTGDDVAQAIPAASASRTRMGGLKIQSEYPADIVFAPCSLQRPLELINREGFTIRDFDGPCGR